MSATFLEFVAQWDSATDGQFKKEDVEGKMHDQVIGLVLSQYFRKYVKYADAVPADLNALISGETLFCFLVGKELTQVLIIIMI